MAGCTQIWAEALGFQTLYIITPRNPWAAVMFIVLEIKNGGTQGDYVIP